MDRASFKRSLAKHKEYQRKVEVDNKTAKEVMAKAVKNFKTSSDFMLKWLRVLYQPITLASRGVGPKLRNFFVRLLSMPWFSSLKVLKISMKLRLRANYCSL